MSRRIALALTVVTFSLMACTVGEATKAPKEGRTEVSAVANNDVAKDPSPTALPVKATPQVPEIREVEQSLIVTAEHVEVELVKGTVRAVPFTRRSLSGTIQLNSDSPKLAITVRVTNLEALRPLKYDSWHAALISKYTPEPLKITAMDEFGTRLAPWCAGTASWPTSGVERTASIRAEESVTDIIAFQPPATNSEEVFISLPGENIGIPGAVLRFQIGRQFFEDKATRIRNVQQASQPAEERQPPKTAPAKPSPSPTGQQSASVPRYLPTSGSSAKTVHVNGYTRKDGTHVAPHMRSAPRR